MLGQVRPPTTQTLYRSDLDRRRHLDDDERPLVARALRLGEIIEGEITIPSLRERVRVLCIPVRCGADHRGADPGVGADRRSPPGRARADLRRDLQPLRPHDRRGRVPVRARTADARRRPRVGDGVIVLDGSGRVEYASPNAISALHRMGVHANTEGMRLGELGLDDDAVRTRLRHGLPVTEEVERGPRSPCSCAASRCSTTARCPARWCCSATSPSSAAGTGCCCRRTPPSARSTTG